MKLRIKQFGHLYVIQKKTLFGWQGLPWSHTYAHYKHCLNKLNIHCFLKKEDAEKELDYYNAMFNLEEQP